MKLGKQKSLEEQLKEHKEKEKQILKRIEEDKKQKELTEQIAKERELLENEKKRKEHLEKENKRIKELEQKQQKIELDKAKKEQPIHPEGCFCKKCVKMRKPKKESKFKLKFLSKSKPKSVVTKSEMSEYNTIKKDPTKLVSFITKQRMKFQKNNTNKKSVDAIDTKVYSSFKTDIVVLGLRLAIGISFIVHGISKLDADGQIFAGMLSSWGLPIELSFPIAMIEILSGVFLLLGFLTRISSACISIIMLGAIFVIKGASSLIGAGGVELDVIILASVILISVFGPGRLSVANIPIKGRIFTRFLQ